MRTSIYLGLLGLMFFLSMPVYASNFSFLNYTSVYYLTSDDWTIIKKTSNDVLNDTRDNVKVTWRNPQTGAYGFMIPSQANSFKGAQCRQLMMYSVAKGVSGESTYRFCLINGTWKVVD